MVELAYDKLFQIDVSHSYYANEIPRDLTLAPTPHTTRLLSNAGIRVETLAGAMAFWENRNSPISAEISEPWTFHLLAGSSFFSGYTHVADGVAEPEKSVYFATADPADTSAVVPLVNEARPPVLLTALSARQAYSVPQPKEGTKLSVLHHGDDTKLAEWTAPPGPVRHVEIPGAFHSQLATEQRLRLFLDDALLTDFVFVSRPIPSLWGVIGIGPAHLKKALSGKMNFSLAFQSTKSDWRWILITEDNASGFENWRLVQGQSVRRPLAHSGPEQTTYRGRPAWEVQMTDPVPYRERIPPSDLYYLCPPGGDNEDRSAILLPNASPQNAVFTPGIPSQSQIYVML